MVKTTGATTIASIPLQKSDWDFLKPKTFLLTSHKEAYKTNKN